MFTFFTNFFQKENIGLFAAVPLSACRVIKPYLLERAGIQSGTVIVFAVPYYTSYCDHPERNISAYAVSRDYHLYFTDLFDRLLPALREGFPDYRFTGFADHSPIHEQDAAARGGLGVIGKNHLLLTESYSSYVFLGEVITNATLDCAPTEPRYCNRCGRCTRACPSANGGMCLSELSQSKRMLSVAETDMLKAGKSLWGCDICQQVCPYTLRAKESGSIYSPIPFFSNDPVPYLDAAVLDEMDSARFAQRAYSWRGRNVIERNLQILNSDQKGDHKC